MKKQSVLLVLLLLLLLTLCACETHTHDYEVTDKKEATCTESGYIVQCCKVCGETSHELLPAAGHDWEEATCKQPETCKVCGETSGTALTHSMDSSTGRCEYFNETLISLRKKLPTTIAYKWGDGTYTELRATSVSYTWFSDELTVTITGEKTYDWKGDYGTTAPNVLVILRDSVGSVIASDHCTAWDDIIVGQTFHESVTFKGVKKGSKYSVELTDYEI